MKKTVPYNKPFAILAGLSILMCVPFLIAAVKVGMMGINIGLKDNHPTLILNPSGWMPTNYSLSVHMILGAFIMFLAPIQVLLGWSKKGLSLHRFFGKIFFVAAMITEIVGLFYVLVEGTTGGTVMSVAFGLYGIFMIIATWQTMRYARSKQMGLHEKWSLRLFLLAMSSWFYRIGYGLNIFLTGGVIGHTLNFQGPFDYFMDFAFFIPPLLLLEWYFRKLKPMTKAVHPLLVSFTVLSLAIVASIGMWGFFGRFFVG